MYVWQVLLILCAARVRAHALYYRLQYGLEYESSVMCPEHLAIADSPPTTPSASVCFGSSGYL